ncbi:MAG: gliding motility-associated C-terminal domain-containing protein [Bacteroidales bacterium]|nr:gliding motility-associated C-terminal domain-containing protein [Bacteroidales bacterium]
MKVRLFILFILLSTTSVLKGQLPPPVLTYVTVNPYTSDITLEWDPSPTTEEIKFYRIWVYDPIVEGSNPILSVDGSNTNCTFKYPDVEKRPLTFSLDAINESGNAGILSNELSTTHLKLIYDSCLSYIFFIWDTGFPWAETDSFNLYRMPDTTFIASLSGRSYLTYEFPVNEELCYFIENISKDKRPAYSPKACIFTKQPKKPDFINTDQVSIINNEIHVDFSWDVTAQTSKYFLLRSVNDTSYFDTINRYFDYHEKHLTFIDNDASIQNINYYKLMAYNNCNKLVQTSNIGGNIVLSSSLKDNVVSLNWNSYTKWIGEADHYTLYRYSRNYTRLDTFYISGESTKYLDNIDSLVYEGYFDQLCYMIEAHEGNGNPHGIKGISYSNKSFLYVEPLIPNAFTPNGDLQNDTYRPVSTLIAKDYKLMIRDRWGGVVFESSNPGEEWDGFHPGKNKVEPGVYVFYLKFTTKDGLEVVKNGTVTVILPNQN